MSAHRPSPGLRPPSPRFRGARDTGDTHLESPSPRFRVARDTRDTHLESPSPRWRGEGAAKRRMRGGPLARCLLLTACLLLAATAAAQVRESVTVNLVEVPVSVVDGSGNAVRGLTAANFELYDKGKKQQ